MNILKMPPQIAHFPEFGILRSSTIAESTFKSDWRVRLSIKSLYIYLKKYFLLNFLKFYLVIKVSFST